MAAMSAADPDEEVFEAIEGSHRLDLMIAAGTLVVSWSMALLPDQTAGGFRVTMMVVGAAAAVAIALTSIRRVRLGPAALTVDYGFRECVVRYADITNVEIQARSRARAAMPDYEVIVVTRRHGGRVTLKGLEDGIVPLYSALHRRWMNQPGGPGRSIRRSGTNHIAATKM